MYIQRKKLQRARISVASKVDNVCAHQGLEKHDSKRIITACLRAVRNAKTAVQQRRCSAPPRGQMGLLQRGSTAAVPLYVEHSHISGLGGQRLVSVTQYTIIPCLTDTGGFCDIPIWDIAKQFYIIARI